MSFSNCLIVMLGGALGTLARYVVSVAALPISSQLPWATIIVNVTGSLVIGFFGTLTFSGGRFPVSEPLRLFVMIGICGGYTTFSSFSLQTVELIRAGGLLRAALNVGLSVVLCISAVAIGNVMALRLNAHYH